MLISLSKNIRLWIEKKRKKKDLSDYDLREIIKKDLKK